MDQRQKLEPFLLLVKNARGKAAADLIQKVTSEPGIFAFSELTLFQGVQELQGTELDVAYKLLLLFCFGTWADYKGFSGQIKLNPVQVAKLKQLTVVSMAGTTQKLMYRDLMAQLEIDNIRDLEDLLISDCFHTGLISGKLDQKEQCLYVTNAASRDVKPEDVQGIVDKLFQWLQKSKETQAAIEAGIQNIQLRSKQAKEAQAQAENQFAQAKVKFQSVSTPHQGGQIDTLDLGEPDSENFIESTKKAHQSAGSKRRR